MVTDVFFKGLLAFLEFIFGWVNLPQFPESLRLSIDNFLDLIFDNLSFLGFFIRPSTIKIIIPLFLVLVNFKYIYNIIMWILNKLVIFKS